MAVAGTVAMPAAASLAVVATVCLCGIMVVRHRTQSQISVRVKKGEGFVFDLGRDAGVGRDTITNGQAARGRENA
jgi:hypothetical protein